jgi:hypothetical protein
VTAKEAIDAAKGIDPKKRLYGYENTCIPVVAVRTNRWRTNLKECDGRGVRIA